MDLVKQNILVDSRGRPRLSDIGFAKLASTGESTFDWAQVGADGCRWAAPEIFQNGKLSKQSDVFTYGFLAVEVCSPNRHLASPIPTFARYSRENFYGRGLTQRE
jgi:serine/threonine protein kinase